MTENELRHYGVKGMKWGVRRYQNKDGSLTAAGKKRYSSDDGQNSTDRSSENNVSRGKSAIKSLSNKKVSELSNDYIGSGELTTLAVQAVSVAAIIGIGYGMQKHSTNKKLKELDKMRDNREFKSLSDVPKLKEKETPEQSMKKVNPGYPSAGSTMNCTFCTTAMVMREKGYDVTAKKSTTGWPGKELFEKTFNSPRIQMGRKNTSEKMIDTLSSQGKDAYGNLTVYWNLGGGHSVFWKNINGKTHIYDGQSGEEYDVSNPKNSTFLKSIDLKRISYNRLDNCEPTEYALSILEKRKSS